MRQVKLRSVIFILSEISSDVALVGMALFYVIDEIIAIMVTVGRRRRRVNVNLALKTLRWRTADCSFVQTCNLWPPCIAGCGHIYFHPVVSSFFFLFRRLISAVGHWMSTILPHMVWP